MPKLATTAAPRGEMQVCRQADEAHHNVSGGGLSPMMHIPLPGNASTMLVNAGADAALEVPVS